jgi:hypothetical protein
MAGKTRNLHAVIAQSAAEEADGWQQTSCDVPLCPVAID